MSQGKDVHKCINCGKPINIYKREQLLAGLCSKCVEKEKKVPLEIKYSPKDTINACKEAHQGGSDFILCNLICLVSDLKQKGYDKKTLDELDKFIERFK